MPCSFNKQKTQLHVDSLNNKGIFDPLAQMDVEEDTKMEDVFEVGSTGISLPRIKSNDSCSSLQLCCDFASSLLTHDKHLYFHNTFPQGGGQLECSTANPTKSKRQPRKKYKWTEETK